LIEQEFKLLVLITDHHLHFHLFIKQLLHILKPYSFNVILLSLKSSFQQSSF
jgi:hypothetical protein